LKPQVGTSNRPRQHYQMKLLKKPYLDTEKLAT
jgi:hypothetical protein